MQTVLEILNKCTEYFVSKKIPQPKNDAQLLLSHALGCKRLDLFLRFEEPLQEEKLSKFRELVRRRAKREPLQHIIGTVDFFGVTIKTDARALIPRHETEELCELVSQKFQPDSKIKILDLGTGSGAIALSLANYFKEASVDAVDFSDDAIALANENLELLNLSNVKIFKSDWFENVVGKYDVILANPPYLTDDELSTAEPEVKDFDPISALTSPDSGLADLKKIISQAPAFMAENAILICECGVDHPLILQSLFSNSFKSTTPLKDISSRFRFFYCS